MPNLHPFFVKEMSVKQFGFAITVRDMTVEGAKDADLKDIRYGNSTSTELCLQHCLDMSVVSTVHFVP